MKRLITAMIAVTFLAGCARPVNPSTAARVTPTGDFLQGETIMTVSRDSGMQAAGVDIQISVDGKLAAVLSRATTVTLRMPAGDHRVTAASYGGFSGEVKIAPAVITTSTAAPANVRLKNEYGIFTLWDVRDL